MELLGHTLGEMHAIGIDVGSSNIKVAVVDSTGRLLASASRPLVTSHANGAVTQDPEALWDTTRDAIRSAVSAITYPLAGPVTIGVCSQYSSLVPIGEDGHPIGPIIMYMDTRGTDRCWQIMERHPEAFDIFVERHGIPPIGAGLTLAHLLYLQFDQPNLFERTSVCLEVMDYVNLRLTGRVSSTQATMFASQLCDNRTVGITTYDPDLLAMSGVERSKLPPLLALDESVGTILPDLAIDLGLPPDTSVRAGMNDTHAASLATGVLSPDESSSQHSIGVVIGTTAVLVASAPEHRVDLEHEILTMPSPIPGHHLVMAENGVVGRSVEHFFELAGIDVFGSGGLDGALGSSEPGAGGLLFLPWFSGSMSPESDSAMRGGVLGLSLRTTRSDIVRAAIEGAAMNVAWLLPAVETLAGSQADRIVFSGGAARSKGWAQVIADVCERPVDVVENSSVATAVAVATAAAQAETGHTAPIAARISSTHLPRSDRADLYRRHSEQFRAAFSQTRRICEALGHD